MGLEFMLAKECKQQIPKNWLVSEKYDGYRSRYEPGLGFFSRNNNQFHAPDWFISIMPNYSLDGELWCGRDKFQSLAKIRKNKTNPDDWFDIKYVVYDLPDSNDIFSKRLIKLKNIVDCSKKKWYKIRTKLGKEYGLLDCPIIFAKQTPIESKKHFNMIYNNIIENKGEGVIIKNPDSHYEDLRSDNMLKYKPVYDSEAIIVDYKESKTNKNKIGAFICNPLENHGKYSTINYNLTFTVPGITDNIGSEPDLEHPIGSIITYQYSGKTDIGKPRFPRYQRKRNDIIILDKSNHEKEILKNIINILKSKMNKEKNNVYKFQAYSNAIESLKNYNTRIGISKKNLFQLSGIGKSISKQINDYLDSIN